MVNCCSWDCGNCWARTCLGPPISPWGWLQQPAQLSPALAWRITHSAAIRCLCLSSPNAEFSDLPTLLVSMASTELTPCSTSSMTSPMRGRREERRKAEEGGVHLSWCLTESLLLPRLLMSWAPHFLTCNFFRKTSSRKSWKATREDGCCGTESYSMPTAPACHALAEQ